MSRFPRQYAAALAVAAALAASATHLTAQTKQAKTVEDFELAPLSEERAEHAEPLEYEHTASVQSGRVERGIAKTISPADQPLDRRAPASASTRLEQGTGTRPAAAPPAPETAATEPQPAAAVPQPAPVAEIEPELPAAPELAASPSVAREPAATLPPAPTSSTAAPELATEPEPELAPAEPPAAAASHRKPDTATRAAANAGDRLTATASPVSASRSFGRIVKAKPASTATVATAPAAADSPAPVQAASVGINPRGRGRASRPTATSLAGTTAPAAPGLSIEGAATSAALLAATEPADSTQLAQRSSARRYVERPWSYISLGGSFGLNNDGKTELSDTAFALGGKIGITPYLSARPLALLGDRATFLLPVTYDIAISQSDPFKPATFVPYLGGGVLLTTHDGNNFGPLVTGGMDVRVSDSIVINAGINAGFLRDETELGLTVGVGYIFPGNF